MTKETLTLGAKEAEGKQKCAEGAGRDVEEISVSNASSHSRVGQRSQWRTWKEQPKHEVWVG